MTFSRFKLIELSLEPESEPPFLATQAALLMALQPSLFIIFFFQVILTAGEKKFDDIKDNIYQMDRKHKICFESDDIQKEYFR